MLQVEQLRNNQRRNFIVDRRAEHDDALLQQAREKIPRTLAARGALDNCRNRYVWHSQLLYGTLILELKYTMLVAG
jgi:hypothetical protein